MNIQTIRIAALCLAVVATPAFAAELTLPKDGWTSWQVEAVEGAPEWCCWSGRGDSDASRASCKLDQDSGNFGSRDKQTTDSVRVYARLAGGKVERLRVLSATCPVEARTPIHELGDVAVDDSAHWLTALSNAANWTSQRCATWPHATAKLYRAAVSRSGSKTWSTSICNTRRAAEN